MLMGAWPPPAAPCSPHHILGFAELEVVVLTPGCPPGFYLLSVRRLTCDADGDDGGVGATLDGVP